MVRPTLPVGCSEFKKEWIKKGTVVNNLYHTVYEQIIWTTKISWFAQVTQVDTDSITFKDTHTHMQARQNYAHTYIVTHLQTNTYLYVRHCSCVIMRLSPMLFFALALYGQVEHWNSVKSAESNGTDWARWSKTNARQRERGIRTEKIWEKR